MTKVFILGAPDPEMEEVERAVREAGHEIRYAMIRDFRVRADQAYNADNLNAPMPGGPFELVFVECSVMGLWPDVIVDHHQEGDPGYGQPPSEYLYSSSLGQTLRILGLEPTQLQRIIAAADHCPTQAYRGECPGISPEELAAWRTASRAARRGVTPAEMDAAILSAKELLETADRVEFCGEAIPWVTDRKGEIPEASARYNIPFMYAEPLKDGRTKCGIMGAAPRIIASWMAQCGLAQVYGDPVRGYAGGYC
jgi:hypothetical protein